MSRSFDSTLPAKPFHEISLYAHNSMIEICEDEKYRGQGRRYVLRVYCSVKKSEQIRDLLDGDTRIRSLAPSMVEHPGTMRYEAVIIIDREDIREIWQDFKTLISSVILGTDTMCHDPDSLN